MRSALCLLLLSSACTCGGGVLNGTEDTPALCKDGKDNDGDGKIDCADPDCRPFTFCTGGTGGGSGGGSATGGGAQSGDAGPCGSVQDLSGCSCTSAGDTRPCYTGTPDTRNEGACHDGTQTCQQAGSELSATWSACGGDQTPTPEVCTDTMDHDCNGAAGCTDTGCLGQSMCLKDCNIGDTRPCYTGAPGTSGVGICHAGTQSCGLEGQWDTACNGQVTPGSEGTACSDTLDNDCDGKTDCQDLDCTLACIMVCSPSTMQSCYAGPPGTAGVATCKAGTETCAADGKSWGPCDGQVLPGNEGANCMDGVDNDCNGKIDCGDPACRTQQQCCVMRTGSPADGTIYAHSSSDLYTVDPATWAVTHVGSFAIQDEITDIAVTPSNALYGVSFSALYSIDKTTGHATYVADVSGTANNGLTFLPDGTLLASDTSGEVKRINPSTGAVMDVGNFNQSLSSAGDLVAVADGTMYGVSSTTAGGGDASSNNVLLRVDTSTGAATAVGPIGFGDVWGLAYVNAKVIGFTTAGKIIQIDPATGAGTLLATRSVVFWGAGMSPLVEVNPCP
jgi:hypothetical protein